MKCPADIADVLLEILRTGILRIRVMDRSADTFLEADHLHNIPTLLQNYSPELLKYYWEIERPSFVKRCTSCAQFEPLWEKLRGHMETKTLRPSQEITPSPPSPLPR